MTSVFFDLLPIRLWLELRPSFRRAFGNPCRLTRADAKESEDCSCELDVPNAEGTLSALRSRDAGNQLVAASVDSIPASPAAQQ